jgi:hypothetical protein
MGAAGLRWVEDLPGYEAYAVDAAGERSATSGLTRYLAG